VDSLRIGIDLGGSKIEVIALDNAGTELLRRRVTTPQNDYQATLEAISRLVTATEQALAASGSIGICTPGAISRATGLLKNSNSVCLNGKPLLKDLQARLQRSLRIANDADCFTLSEASDGAAAGMESVFGVIAGTGTGGGIAVHGRLLAGVNIIAGEWGHNPLPWPQQYEQPGPECYCGKKGCIETWLSGPGLVRDYVLAGGEKLAVPAIVQRDLAGEALATQCLARYCDRMARALASVINILDPQVIVLGGGMGNIQRLYHDVPALWGQYVFSDRVDTQLVKPVYGDSSGVRGAAWLWPVQDSAVG